MRRAESEPTRRARRRRSRAHGSNLLLHLLGAAPVLAPPPRPPPAAAEAAGYACYAAAAHAAAAQHLQHLSATGRLTATGTHDNGAAVLLGRLLAPPSGRRRETDTGALLRHPWALAAAAARARVTDALLPLFARPPTPPVAPAPRLDALAAAPAASAEGVFRVDLLAVVAAAWDGCGPAPGAPIWIVVAVGPVVAEECPWLRPFDFTTRSGWAVSRADGTGPEEWARRPGPGPWAGRLATLLEINLLPVGGGGGGGGGERRVLLRRSVPVPAEEYQLPEGAGD